MSKTDNRPVDRPRTERFREYGITVFRIVIGGIFLAHGWLKFFGMGIGGATTFFAHIGVPLPTLSAWFSALAETVGGLALILGVFTPVVGAALAIDMLGAIVFAKLHGGFFAPKGYEFELTLLAGAVALVLTGPGAFALRDVGQRRGERGERPD